MKLLAAVVFAIFIAGPGAICSEKDFPQLIGELAVKDKGNITCNTACVVLVAGKDEAVPALRDALRNDNDQTRYYAVQCLGQINTKAARSALIDAYSNGVSDVRKHAAYALTWTPEQDAEEIYLDGLMEHDQWHVRKSIKALGEIKSEKAVPPLRQIRDNPPDWYTYYATIIALRKIESQQLTPEVQTALTFMRQAKFSQDIDTQKLNDAANVIRQNLPNAMPDVFDIFLSINKGKQSKAEPNAKTILRDAGPLALPVVQIGVKDPDERVSRSTKLLVEEFGWDKLLQESLRKETTKSPKSPPSPK